MKLFSIYLFLLGLLTFTLGVIGYAANPVFAIIVGITHLILGIWVFWVVTKNKLGEKI